MISHGESWWTMVSHCESWWVMAVMGQKTWLTWQMSENVPSQLPKINASIGFRIYCGWSLHLVTCSDDCCYLLVLFLWVSSPSRGSITKITKILELSIFMAASTRKILADESRFSSRLSSSNSSVEARQTRLAGFKARAHWNIVQKDHDIGQVKPINGVQFWMFLHGTII